MQKDLISIIVPLYNVEKYLHDFLKSLNDLKYPNYEIIFIDDGSKDNSFKIVKKNCEDKSNYILYRKINGGVSSARNLGLKHAKGKYIMFFDADDIVHPYILNILEEIISMFKTDLSICSIKKCKDTFKLKKINNIINLRSINLFKGSDCLMSEQLGGRKFNYGPVNKLYRMDILKKINGFPNLFDVNCKHGEDLIFNINYIKKCQTAVFLNKKLYFYKQHKSSTVFSKNPDKAISAKLGDSILFALDKKIYKETQIYIHSRICDENMIILNKIIKSSFNNKEFTKKIYNEFKENIKYCFKSKKSLISLRYFMWIRLPYIFIRLKMGHKM